MNHSPKPVLDGPLRTVVILAFIAAVLGVVAYVPTWHGSMKSMLKMSFWAVACLSVIIIPLAAGTGKERRGGG